LIGESAAVTAQIRAASIIVAGEVKDEITASQSIELRPSARVLGKLTAPKLVVHEGARRFDLEAAVSDKLITKSAERLENGKRVNPSSASRRRI